MMGIQPAFAVDVSTSISDSEEECDICPKVSKQHIYRLINLLDKLEKYDNQLSVLSKRNPEFEEKYREISKIVTDFKEINKELKQVANGDTNIDFCDALGKITGVLLIPYILFVFYFQVNHDKPILQAILLPFVFVISIIGFTGFILYWTLCFEMPPPKIVL
jgi:hypothetical protein